VPWLSAAPAAIALVLLWLLVGVVGPMGPVLVEWPWVPSLGLNLTFLLDGLGLLFGLVITGIGAIILLYASSYLQGHPDLPRLVGWLFVFMGAMLGIVLSDNLIATFVFWELTGLASFMLIGFEHDNRDARGAAMQALIVTGGGGLALLAAAVLLAQITGTLSISAMAASSVRPSAHPLYGACVALVCLAAFTKSAQVPFHFWLPSAMAAPTPVSAYLHSATMVKAGVYLLARLTPVIGGTDLWSTTLMAAGGITMVGAAWRSLQEVDLKRVLAYSTVSALGALVLLIGIGTRGAIVAALIYLIAHACYKGTLFMVAGAIDHETGTRDVTRLSGLRLSMPRTATASLLAAASMMGLPLFVGFLGKELLYESGWHSPRFAVVALTVAVLASAFGGAAALVAGWGPFVGRPQPGRHPHDPPAAMWLGPLVLAVTGLLLGVMPGVLGDLVGLAAAGVLGTWEPVSLSLWHGLTPILGLSVLTVALAVSLYGSRAWFRRHRLGALGFERLYSGSLGLLDRMSAAVGPRLQSGSLRAYVMILILTVSGLVTTALVMGGPWRLAPLTAARPWEVAIGALICVAAIAAARATSPIRAVVALGAVGYGVALLFVMYGAPDLAMTQFSVETLTVVIFVLVFRMFGSFAHLSSRLVRTRDALVAAVVGAGVSVLVLLVGGSPRLSRLSDFFVEAAPTLAHGRNVVNVILVDFRAFDTLGEITVLAVAAIGVHALLRIGADERGRS
jgi:multicomponent Na+:H+ antiporter subunit A